MDQNFQVLALKYRPHKFADLIGQETIVQTLSAALDSDRLSHAYLFSGLRGSGKTSTARIFAKALVCSQGPTSHPCETCEQCVAANSNRHLDIVEMDAASSRKIDDIRDLIEHTKYKPSLASFKVFIIDEVHMLTKEAFNALLKTLEEPPAYVKFILATTDPLKLPATILSRTQHFRFKKISTTTISSHLAHILNLENITYESEALDILARSGSGSLRDTLTLLDQAIIYSKNHIDVVSVTKMLGLIDPQFFEHIMQLILTKNTDGIILELKNLEEYESEMVVDELTSWLKERLYSGDLRFSIVMMERFFKILSEAKSLFHINADDSFVLGLLLFKMLEAMKVKEIDQMIESLETQVQKPLTNSSTDTTTIKATVDKPSTPDTSLDLFEKLCAAIHDRSSELGEHFRDSISFISYEDETLVWESCATDEAKEQLRHNYSVIKQLVQEVYGFGTKIKHNACSQEEERPAFMQEEAPQSGSTIQTVQLESTTKQSQEEVDSGDILQEPMVQKATELFNPTKITIQSKV